MILANFLYNKNISIFQISNFKFQVAYIAGIVLIGLKVGDETIGTLYHTHVYKNINCTQSLDRPTEPWWCKALYDMQFGKFFFLFNCFLKKYNWTDNSVHDFKKSQTGQTVSWKKSVELRKYGEKLTLNLEVKNAWSKIQIFFLYGWMRFLARQM